ncbi:DUF3427 domain-containing protein [Butyrivibrio sp. FC2001]|uniref:DUF3427 domain-containing protein n=1 Tax=Butyrivibrio sp. FC2001 TaxID=1280671 RepID=UPI0003FF79F8|nr:DUF3427 domain-containing protein [Butyrivibrio sp. FC2001]
MKLDKYNRYSREEVHDIFEPGTVFTPQAGTWGLRGIVEIKNSPGDYVLFVTIGKKVSGHEFVEEVFEDGSFTWQSQPSNGFDHKYIKALTRHNPDVNDVYLFLRTSGSDPYTYLGTLEYVTHDKDKEKPVYFMWHILDFGLEDTMKVLPDLIIKSRNGSIVKGNATHNKSKIKPQGELRLDIKPVQRSAPKPVSTKDFSGKDVDFQGEAKKNSAIGKSGEDAVVEYEKRRLTDAGRQDLADRVIATRETIGNSAKYDVQSFEVDGKERYIEVKTTTGAKSNRFHISEREVFFSECHPDEYYLYRVYNFDKDTHSGDVYIEKGKIDRALLSPTAYLM